MHWVILFLSLFCIHPVVGVPCGETYNVSKSSNALANFHNISIGFIDTIIVDLESQLTKELPEALVDDLVEIMQHSLPYGFVVGVVGVTLFLIFFILFVTQAACGCCSSPSKAVWEGSVGISRFSLIVGCFFVALTGAAGLFSASELYSHLADPLIRVSQTINNDYIILNRSWNLLITIAPEFNILVPSSLSDLLEQYLADVRDVNTSLLTITEQFVDYASYFTFIAAIAFGLTICVCVFATMVAIQKSSRGIPKWTILTILLAVWLTWILSVGTTVVSLALAKQCDIGIDKVVLKTIADIEVNNPCLALITSHFLFCGKWPASDPCGGNPFTQAIGFAQQAISYIEKLPNHDRYIKEINSITFAIDEFNLLSQCQMTAESYKGAKTSLCWNINNDTTHVTALLVIQTLPLLIILCFMLYAWHAFGSSYKISFYKRGSIISRSNHGHGGDVSESECQELEDLSSHHEDSWAQPKVKMTASHVCSLFKKQPGALVLSFFFVVALALVGVGLDVVQGQLEVFEGCT
eukprot:TRINITY_DN14745_c0_g1_i1.p1 TRINITY_DN14745_c0_g1~~TRINITY_DN14745_c0_g1_i1.p1  ORF type:complete len:524 (-),score=78.25 TRINITY_DN14745_c0_g1_i1:24-1595(-)